MTAPKTELPPVADLFLGIPDDPIWEAWADGERFVLHRCGVCHRHDWPASCCPDHGLAAMQWVEVAGAGVVDTYTVFHHAYSKDAAGEVPYCVAVVRLDEGPYFHTQIVDTDPLTVTTGMRVQLRRGAGDAFPLFAPD